MSQFNIESGAGRLAVHIERVYGPRPNMAFCWFAKKRPSLYLCVEVYYFPWCDQWKRFGLSVKTEVDDDESIVNYLKQIKKEQWLALGPDECVLHLFPWTFFARTTSTEKNSGMGTPGVKHA